MSVTFAKLKSGEYGIRSDSELPLGQPVMVATKAGDARPATPVQLVWSGQAPWSDHVQWLYAIEQAPKIKPPVPARTRCPHCGRYSDDPVSASTDSADQVPW